MTDFDLWVGAGQVILKHGTAMAETEANVRIVEARTAGDEAAVAMWTGIREWIVRIVADPAIGREFPS